MTPFYTIRIDDLDITPYVASFQYEDCTEEDDMLSLSMPALPETLLDDERFKVGKDIEFLFGYRGGVASPLRVMRISDIDWQYGQTVTATVKGYDYGQLLKKVPYTKVWVNKTASEIATEIARFYGLETNEIERTSYRYSNLPQAQKTDWELLQWLVDREKDGSFHFYIKNNALFFKRMELNQNAANTFTYGLDIITFKPSLKDAQNTTDKNLTALADPLTGKTTNIAVDNANAKDARKLGANDNGTNTDRDATKQVIKYNNNGKVEKK